MVVLGLAVLALLAAVFEVVFLAAVVLAVVLALGAGSVRTLAAFGVGVVVHCQPPLTSTHAWPSGASVYGNDSAIVWPSGASKRAWPALLDKISPVSFT